MRTSAHQAIAAHQRGSPTGVAGRLRAVQQRCVQIRLVVEVQEEQSTHHYYVLNQFTKKICARTIKLSVLFIGTYLDCIEPHISHLEPVDVHD
jgi:hypothetical protein